MTLPLEEGHRERVAKLRRRLEDEGLSALIVWHPANIRYLTGFTGSSGVLIVTGDEGVLLSDFRYQLQAEEEASGVAFQEIKGRLGPDLIAFLAEVQGIVGIEEAFLTIDRWNDMGQSLEEHSIRHRFVRGAVERLRETKDESEIKRIRDASALVSQAFAQLESMRVVGRPERDVALDLEIWVRRRGSEPVPFSYIVAAGPRGAMPHAIASEALIPPDTLLVVDIGATVGGYSSDMSRTFATGEVSSEGHRAHELVRTAQEAALARARTGVRCSEVDRAARSVIEDGQMGDVFGHGVGHGVGLEVHEGPRLGPGSDELLRSGMVTTIEPGVYLPGRAGVRIEDTVLIGQDGSRCLTEFPRDLLRLR